MLFLPFHTTILKPDLNLSFCKAQRMRDFDPAPAREVPVEVEFFFEFEYLVSGVGGPCAFVVTIVRPIGPWKWKMKVQLKLKCHATGFVSVTMNK